MSNLKIVDILLKMSLSFKSLLVVALSLSAIYLLTLTFTQNEETSIQLAGQETSANLDDASLKKIRNLIKKAGTQYQSNYDSMASFIQGQLNTTIANTLWNVVVFSRQDADRKFTTTLTFLGQKKYYEVYEPDNYTFSVRILQTNDTNHDTPAPAKKLQKISSEEMPETIEIEGLTFTKKKSPYVTSSQEAGIDLAMTTAYTWNKNILDFTKVAQKLIQTNLNQNWQVLTRFQSLDTAHFGFKYAAVYEEWIEYINYGLGSYVLHVYIFRNYITG